MLHMTDTCPHNRKIQQVGQDMSLEKTQAIRQLNMTRTMQDQVDRYGLLWKERMVSKLVSFQDKCWWKIN